MKKFILTLVAVVIVGGVLLYDGVDRVSAPELEPADPCEAMRREIEHKEYMRFRDEYYNSVHTRFNLAVEILVLKGCLPTFMQGGHYRPSIGDSPRSYLTYVSRRPKRWYSDYVRVTPERSSPIQGRYVYTVRHWNEPNGETWEVGDSAVGVLVACKGFTNPFNGQVGNSF